MTNTATHESIAQAIPAFTPEEMERLMLDFMQNGKTLKDIKGLTTENMEAIYGVAYNAYNAGNLDQAHKVFQFLCYFDHLEHKYWMGLGATRQMIKDFSGAVDAYSFAGILNINDPRAPFQAANCHIALGNRDAAISGLTAAVEFSSNKPEWTSVKSQAEAMLGLLQTNPGQGG